MHPSARVVKPKRAGEGAGLELAGADAGLAGLDGTSGHRAPCSCPPGCAPARRASPGLHARQRPPPRLSTWSGCPARCARPAREGASPAPAAQRAQRGEVVLATGSKRQRDGARCTGKCGDCRFERARWATLGHAGLRWATLGHLLTSSAGPGSPAPTCSRRTAARRLAGLPPRQPTCGAGGRAAGSGVAERATRRFRSQGRCAMADLSSWRRCRHEGAATLARVGADHHGACQGRAEE